MITSIGGYLSIGENNNLSSLSGLENLTYIGGNLEINDNNILTDLTALGNVASVDGSLNIFSNDALFSLVGLGNITSIGESLFINHNYSLTNIDGLENIESIGDYLRITFNSVLANLNGLNSITSIVGYLFILHNDSLISLQGLENVTSIGGELRIQNNKSLLSLEGIDNISAASIDEIDVSLNISLSTCEVESVCDYLANPTGTVSIGGNYSGCNSKQEVIDACNGGIHKNIEEKFTIYPNPAKKNFTISHKTNSSIDCVNIFNHLGKKVLTRYNCTGAIDISKLRQGIYIIELTSNGLKIRQKLVIR